MLQIFFNSMQLLLLYRYSGVSPVYHIICFLDAESSLCEGWSGEMCLWDKAIDINDYFYVTWYAEVPP